MIGRHAIQEQLDSFYERVAKVCAPDQVAVGPDVQALREDLHDLIKARVPVLEEWPTRILAKDLNPKIHDALLEGWCRACMRDPDVAWLGSLLHDMSPRGKSRSMKAWATLCPVSLAQHLQSPISVVGEEAATSAWVRVQASISYHVAAFIARGHPAWDAERQTDWAIALITGIRPSPGRGLRNRAFASLLENLLPRLTPSHWVQIETLGLLPTWQASWQKSGEVMAVWRQWKAPRVVATLPRSHHRPRA